MLALKNVMNLWHYDSLWYCRLGPDGGWARKNKQKQIKRKTGSASLLVAHSEEMLTPSAQAARKMAVLLALMVYP